MLPTSTDVDALTLGSAFKETTNSYKFLWLLAILELLHRSNFEKENLGTDAIIREMLAQAWAPSQLFRLSLGNQDRVESVISSINGLDRQLPKMAAIRLSISEANIKEAQRRLLRYVPTRFLRPWFGDEIRGKSDSEIEKTIRHLSNSEFEKRRPLYRLGKDEIQVNESWKNYFKDNYPIVKAWARLSWIVYLQSKNPSVPAIPNKAYISDERGSLGTQRKRWADLLEKHDIKCIYTKHRLTKANFTLDHFIPWSYVAHDEPWNLIPVIAKPNVNSSKSDRLPNSIYVDGFIALQKLFLSEYAEKTSIQGSYSDILRIPIKNTCQSQEIEKILRTEIHLLIDGAKRLGFSTWSCPPDLLRG